MGLIISNPDVQKLNDAQLAWYQGQIYLDEKEKYELYRDIAEHNAMFTNPEGVQKIREAREHTYQTSDEDFEKLVKDTFGRELPKQQKTGGKLDTYLEMELDDVSFIPEKL